MPDNIGTKNKLDNKSIKNIKVNRLKLTFLKKNHDNSKVFINNILNKVKKS